MADAAEAQREARRRRILHNAEERMNRLLGKSPETISKDEVSFESRQEAPLVNDNVRTTPVHTSPYNLRSRHPRVTSPGDDTEKPSHELSSNTRAADPIFLSRELGLPMEENESKTEEIASEIQPSRKAVKGTLPQKDEGSPTDVCITFLKGLNAQTFELLKIGLFIMVAFVSRQLLKLGIGLFIIQSIFFPFIILELAIMYVSHTYLKHIPLKSPRGSPMSAALLLCGLKQEVMESYNLIMAYTNAAFSDISLYFFAFILCYGLS